MLWTGGADDSILLTPCPHDPTKCMCEQADALDGRCGRLYRRDRAASLGNQGQLRRADPRNVQHEPRGTDQSHGVRHEWATRPALERRAASRAPISILTSPPPFFHNGAKSGFEMWFDIGSQHLGCWGQNTSPHAHGCDLS